MSGWNCYVKPAGFHSPKLISTSSLSRSRIKNIRAISFSLKTSSLPYPSSKFPFPPSRCHTRLHPPVSHVSSEVWPRPPARYSILACCTPRHGSSFPRKQQHCREGETSLAQRENREAVPGMF